MTFISDVRWEKKKAGRSDYDEMGNLHFCWEKVTLQEGEELEELTLNLGVTAQDVKQYPSRAPSPPQALPPNLL